MTHPVYNAELERITKSLMEMIGNQSIDPITQEKMVTQTLRYAYTLGKSDGYVAGVKSVLGDAK